MFIVRSSSAVLQFESLVDPLQSTTRKCSRSPRNERLSRNVAAGRRFEPSAKQQTGDLDRANRPQSTSRIEMLRKAQCPAGLLKRHTNNQSGSIHPIQLLDHISARSLIHNLSHSKLSFPATKSLHDHVLIYRFFSFTFGKTRRRSSAAGSEAIYSDPKCSSPFSFMILFFFFCNLTSPSQILYDFKSFDFPTLPLQ